MCAGIIEAVSEAMAFAHARACRWTSSSTPSGKGRAPASWYFVHRAPNMVRGAYQPGFRVRLHAKDGDLP
jgi:3-hydroxyisobutyrate dehydrogenase-like beta-hydroxyacid dehydrogenase